jgi:hypothetical protein
MSEGRDMIEGKGKETGGNFRRKRDKRQCQREESSDGQTP